MDWIGLITILIGPLGGVVGWFAGSLKRKNDAIGDMQATIDLLAKTNSTLMEEILMIKRQNSKLIIQVESLRLENESLKNEVSTLNEQLKNIKTITKTR